jgi:hypothetical protein
MCLPPEGFSKMLILGNFHENLSGKYQIWLKSDKTPGIFHKDLSTFYGWFSLFLSEFNET